MLNETTLRQVVQQTMLRSAYDGTIVGKHPKLTWRLRTSRDSSTRLCRVFLEKLATSFIDTGDLAERIGHVVAVMHEAAATVSFEGKPALVVPELSLVPEALGMMLRWSKGTTCFECADAKLEGAIRARARSYTGELRVGGATIDVDVRTIEELTTLLGRAIPGVAYPFVAAGSRDAAPLRDFPRVWSGAPLEWNGTLVRTSAYGEIELWRDGGLIHTMPHDSNAMLDTFVWHTFRPRQNSERQKLG